MDYSRVNKSSVADCDDWTAVYATGAFKYVYSGKYTEGEDEGRSCVIKVFKSGGVTEDSYFEEELRVCDATQKIINAFNADQAINRPVYLNRPGIWTIREGERLGQKCLVEPMIGNFEKFNSNTGWISQVAQEWGDAMQALSHFSYHHSGGQRLLCDIQGGVYANGFVLTDPVVMTVGGGFGPADLGLEGIRAFFARHLCKGFCKAGWTRPRVGPELLRPAFQGTVMANQLPTRISRPFLSQLREM